MQERVLIMAVSLALLGMQVVALGQRESEGQGTPVDKSRAALDAWLEQFEKTDRDVEAGEADKPTPPPPPKIERIRSEALDRTFPEQAFFAVRYMRYPRAAGTPRGLDLENLVRVRPDGKVERVESVEALKALLAESFRGVRDEAGARTALESGLSLAQEFYQDGRYTFELAPDGVQVERKGERLLAAGRAEVKKGGRGWVELSLAFDKAGDLSAESIQVDGRVKPDARPR